MNPLRCGPGGGGGRRFSGKPKSCCPSAGFAAYGETLIESDPLSAATMMSGKPQMTDLSTGQVETLRWLLIAGGFFLALGSLYAVSKWRAGWLQERTLNRFDLVVGMVVALAAGVHATNLWHEQETVIVENFHQVYVEKWWNSTVRETKWRGNILLKTPLDLWIFQEILYERSPDVVIETGTFRGGTAYYLASLQDMMGKGRVITVDYEKFPTPEHERIEYLLGSSTSPQMIQQVQSLIKPGERVMVTLDSDHSRQHVLEEMRLYGQIVTVGDYMVVEDTHLDGHPVRLGEGDPWSAVRDFLAESDEFVIDESREKFGMTWNRGGWLKKVKSRTDTAQLDNPGSSRPE